MSGGVRNMHVSNCTFVGTDVGLRFKSTRGRGGIVENIFVSDINMINIPTEAIRFNLYYQGGSPIPEPDDTLTNQMKEPEFVPVSEATPEFRNISIKNISCNGAHTAIKMTGLPEMKLNNFSFENINIKSTNGIECTDAKNITFKNLKIECENYPAVKIANSDSLSFDNFSYNQADTPIVELLTKDCNSITFSNTTFNNEAKQIVIPAGSDEHAVVIK